MKSDEIIQKIRERLQGVDPDKRTFKHILQFEFTDNAGQCIKKVVFDFNALKLYDGVCESAVAKIKISDEDFYAVGTHQCTFDELVKEQKVQLQGDTEAINKMIEKFRMNQKN